MAHDFNIPIIMYHDIAPSRLSDLTISPDTLKRQLRALTWLDFTPITFADLDAIVSGRKKRPTNPVIITFDDGYANFKQYAFPVLSKLHIPATVFLPTAYLGKKNTWDRAKKNIERQDIMSADDISELAAHRIEFGSHSATHVDVTTVKGPAREREINHSYELIKKLTGKPVMAFCYPYGHHDRSIRDFIEAKSMYRFAVVIQGPALPYTTSDRYLMPRVFVKRNDFLMRFLWKVFKRTLWNVDFVKLGR